MSGLDFLDTNVLVYAFDPSDPRKQSIAQRIVEKALAGEGAASTQVLSEFAVSILYKLTPRAKPEEVAEILDSLNPIRLVGSDSGVVRRALDACSSYGIHFYDALIVAAAERGGCGRILSEDLNPGQKYFQIPVENPFI